MKTFGSKYRLLLLALAMSIAGCNDNTISSIPDYPVYLSLNLNAQYNTFKNTPNQFLLFEKGYNGELVQDRIGFGGVMVYCGISFDESGNSLYYAFDMACPYEAKNTVKVYPDKAGLPHVICEKCGTVYDVGFGNGNPISGPSKQFLKRYKATLLGSYLQITR